MCRQQLSVRRDLKLIDGSSGGGAEFCFELGEGHLYGNEVGAVRRQKQKPDAMRPDSVFSSLTLVTGKIIQNDDISGPQGGCKLGFDVRPEDRPVHWPVNDPRGDEPVAIEAGHEGPGASVAERSLAVQPTSLHRAPSSPNWRVPRNNSFEHLRPARDD